MRGLIIGILVLTCALAGAQTPGTSEPADADSGFSVESRGSFDVYCDFRCPFCARLFTTLLAGAKAEGRTVDFHFKHYPFHNGSNELALFYEAVVVNYPEQLESLVDSLYKFRRQTEPENIERMISALSTVHGLDLRRIRRDMKARDTVFVLSESKRSAIALGVSSTPTVFQGSTLVTISEPEEIARYMLDQSPRKSLASQDPTVGECSSCEKPKSSK